MSSIMKNIGGREVECFEVNNTGKMLLQLDGAFGGNEESQSFMLVPLTLEEPQLEQISEMWLTVQEAKLGLPTGESCTSSAWWVGTNETKDLDKVTDEYDYLVSAVENKNIVADRILIAGVQDGEFYAVQQHEREKESESFYSLYTVNAIPKAMDPASIEAFLIEHVDRGGSVAGSWEQIMEEFRDFMGWPEPPHQLAADIDEFTYDIDTYEYKDKVEDREQHVMDIEEQIRTGNTEGIVNYLSEILNEYEYHDDEAIAARRLLARLEKVAPAGKEQVAEKPGLDSIISGAEQRRSGAYQDGKAPVDRDR